jgi:hypothetical protein
MYNGVIVDHHQEVIVSQLTVHAGFDAVIYKSKLDTSTRVILPAHRVKSFRYFDNASNINRQFISLRHSGIYRFYEIVIYGEVQVIRRLKRNKPSLETDEANDYNFFLWFRNDLIDLKKFKSIVYPLLVQRYGSELEDFVGQNKLQFLNVAAIFSIVKKCNELSGTQRLVATR